MDTVEITLHVTTNLGVVLMDVKNISKLRIVKVLTYFLTSVSFICSNLQMISRNDTPLIKIVLLGMFARFARHCKTYYDF